MKRTDDGSQEWLDDMTRARIRGGLNFSNTVGLGQEINADNIADPVLRERVLAAKQAGLAARERYSKSWHAGPAHSGGRVLEASMARDIPVSADVDSMNAAIQAKHMSQRQLLNEVDSTEAQLQRMSGNMRGQAWQALDALQQGRQAFPQHNLARLNEVGSANTFQQPQSQQTQSGPSVCRLHQGHACFRALQTGGFGSTVVMARALGQIPPQMAMQEFVIKGYVNVYVVPPHQTTVDMHAIQRNPQLCQQLVEIIAPPASGLGNLLVAQESLVQAGNSPYGQGRAIITDSVSRQMQQHRQMLTDNARPRGAMVNSNQTNTPRKILRG